MSCSGDGRGVQTSTNTVADHSSQMGGQFADCPSVDGPLWGYCVRPSSVELKRNGASDCREGGGGGGGGGEVRVEVPSQGGFLSVAVPAGDGALLNLKLHFSAAQGHCVQWSWY